MPHNAVALNTAIEAIYETAFAPEKWPEALRSISDYFDAEGTLLFFQHADGSYAAVNSPGVLDAVHAQFLSEDWTRRDLRAIRAQEADVFGKTATVADLDLVTLEEIETHPYYTQLLGTHGLAWFMAASISPDPGEFVVLSVQRFKKKPIFNEAERGMLEILSRHAERSLRLSTRMLQAELSNVALGEALEHLGCGVLLLNEGGQVVFSNADGGELLGGCDGDDTRSLIGLGSTTQPALREQIASVLSMPFGAEPDIGKPILIENGRGESPTVAYVLPVAAASKQTLATFGANVSAIVLAINQDPLAPVDPSVVRDILGLTLGEARVASLIGAGRSPREAADALGISEATARTVLKRVFAKTSISKQSHLAALLTRLTLRSTT